MTSRLRIGSRGATFLIVIIAVPRLALANPPIVVGTGTPASCTEAAFLNAAVAANADGGDVIRFNCGPAPVTITMSPATALPDGSMAALVLPDETTVDGGSRVTLARSDVPGNLLAVAPDTTVTLENLTLRGFLVPSPLPIGVQLDSNVVNRGTLVLHHVTIAASGDSTSIVTASIENRGTLKMHDCTVAGLMGTYQSSAPIQNFGTATIDHSTFTGNSHSPSSLNGNNGGGAVLNTGVLEVNNGVFADNSVPTSLGGGGAITNLGGVLTIRNSQFSRNSAYHGGAIENRLGGSITVTNSTFDQNDGFEAGALLGGYAQAAFSTIVVKHSTFVHNSGTYGGAIELERGRLILENTTIADNGAIYGGGISLGETDVTIAHSELKSNDAWFGGGIYSPYKDTIRITNSEITLNDAVSAGGIDLSPTSSLTLVHTDVTDNTPDDIRQ